MAVEMRLQAISMRVSTRGMRAGAPAIAPYVSASAGTAVERSVLSAVLTEQAKGVLAARFSCTPEQALFLLHEHCRRTNVPVTVLAHHVALHHDLSS
ncbi:ANTAR domain-containing protein [Streptomyces kunmingensis]|uniref:ANTAR domain-containing protein n=1 Tax=Streptomyces kunmingensis TaxID=68225 RepID=A0ABU6C1R0_9ACTN|nr:ANTAR domain-containing protein [Streptomyces kunmingensis]MEB3958658.1 ANTAR domain-containing protein [Streptomyces kunmingensis]